MRRSYGLELEDSRRVRNQIVSFVRQKWLHKQEPDLFLRKVGRNCQLLAGRFPGPTPPHPTPPPPAGPADSITPAFPTHRPLRRRLHRCRPAPHHNRAPVPPAVPG